MSFPAMTEMLPPSNMTATDIICWPLEIVAMIFEFQFYSIVMDLNITMNWTDPILVTIVKSNPGKSDQITSSQTDE